MLLPQTLGHQQRHRLPEQLARGITEELHHRLVDKDDALVRVRHDDTRRRRAEHVTKLALAALQRPGRSLSLSNREALGRLLESVDVEGNQHGTVDATVSSEVRTGRQLIPVPLLVLQCAFRRPDQLQHLAGHFGARVRQAPARLDEGPPDALGAQPEHARCGRREAAHAGITPDQDDRDLDAAEHVRQIITQARRLRIAHPHFFIERVELLVVGLDLLLGHLQLLVGAAQLFVAGRHFLVGRPELLIARLQPLDHRLEVVPRRAELTGDLVER